MDTYEAWEMPRGNIVVAIREGDRKHADVVMECITMEEAQHEAGLRNTESWLAERPESAPQMVWGDDWEGRLLAILDRPYELELRAAA